MVWLRRRKFKCEYPVGSIGQTVRKEFMRVQYVITNDEIQKAQDRLAQLRHVALLSRDAGQTEDNREYYLRARGFSEALEILGIRFDKKSGNWAL